MRIKDINKLPEFLLEYFGSNHALLLSRPDTGHGPVAGCTSFDPVDLIPANEFRALDSERRRLKVHSILVCVVRATPELAHEMGRLFPEFPSVDEEIMSLIHGHGEVLSVYAVTHSNPDDRPCGSLTVAIGGDCFREDQVNFAGILERTALLAKAMGRKSVMMFPDIPALHGGKKGEWILLDGQGKAIAEASESVRVALGAVVIKRGIEFLNRFKRGKLDAEVGAPLRGLISMSPDSASPDTLSGKFWPHLCLAWRKMGLDMKAVTCLPADELPTLIVNAGELKIESALPTGCGVAATATKLVQRLLMKQPSECNFLVEALGNVSYYTIHVLINQYGVPPSRITAFDPSPSARSRAGRAFPSVKIHEDGDFDFYSQEASDQTYDVWVNNGLGNRTALFQVEWLLDHGVKIFCGGANNFLRKSDERESLEAIWSRGAWAWPDEAASGGGWTFAVMDLHARTLGNAVRAEDFIRRVIARVEKSNVAIVESVVGSGQVTDGRKLWNMIEKEINARVAKTQSRKLSLQEVVSAADVSAWQL